MTRALARVPPCCVSVAHEINNPLMAVLANLEMLANDLGDFIEAPSTVSTVDMLAELRDAREAAERLRHIVWDLKLFSRGDEETRGRVDVERVLESSLRMVANEIRHRARLVRDYRPIPPVFANESHLGQVFLNLLVNAAQAIPEGHADRNEIRVITSTTDDGRVRVAISDTGTGMPPEIAARIFTPFFTTKPVGVGTGLGLAICHQLVGALGGEIAVDTAAGRGTTFSVTLPPLTGDAPAKTTTLKIPIVLRRRARLLIVDDDELVVSTIVRSLGKDHDVVALSDPHEAARRIHGGERYDRILCDLMMPTGTGMDLYADLLEAAPDQAERIVFITGGAFTERAREFLDDVPNPRLEKPFSLQTPRDDQRPAGRGVADLGPPPEPDRSILPANGGARDISAASVRSLRDTRSGTTGLRGYRPRIRPHDASGCRSGSRCRPRA